ncbi:DUF805 domain-containing protein [Demequina mangrovi]|uniref:Uncharacterized membrane protein YhaH, DUF805 family n=1 Tax=Demequina mangrovi TaxID=1043493 RepID=A0A1H7A894_9MICO|nr:DUF805 domain-containing protein [Demequina mangrovi]SEJ58100.1 Uncharacterized membrane protein YhaH, DUF805 family [Demequina mangrovi]
MGFAEAVAVCFRRFATFRGRARRSEYWWFQLFASVVWLPTMMVAASLWVSALEGSVAPTKDPAIEPDSVRWGLLTLAAVIAFVVVVVIGIPTYAVTARRLHDLDRSAWWLLLAPLSLGFVLMVMAAFPGRRGANRFGPDPRLGAPAHLDVMPG